MILLVAEPGVDFGVPEPDVLTVLRPGRPGMELRFEPDVVAALAATADAPVPATEFVGTEARDAVQFLVRAGLLRITCCDHVDSELLRVRLVGATATFDLAADPDGEPVRLSRFAALRRDGDDLVLDAPRAGTRITFADPRAAAVVTDLYRPRTVHEVAKAVPHLPEELVVSVVQLLLGAGAVGVADGDGLLGEDRSPERGAADDQAG